MYMCIEIGVHIIYIILYIYTYTVVIFIHAICLVETHMILIKMAIDSSSKPPCFHSCSGSERRSRAPQNGRPGYSTFSYGKWQPFL